MLYQLFAVGAAGRGDEPGNPHRKPEGQSDLQSISTLLKRHESLPSWPTRARYDRRRISPHDFEALMVETSTCVCDALQPSAALAKVGDALPGLGIVAAVLGIVITMQAIDGPVEVIGEKVGAALVGTFLGILLSYGFVGPMATAMEHRVGDEANIEQCIMAGLLAIYKGCAPAIAVEFSRRVIPEESRPSFEETEQICRGTREMKEAA
jgi:chemotaxis protein MotA